jgi:uncharacterized sulfatase
MQPTKPAEELYDTQTDPHEIRNLAQSKAHQDILDRLRREQVRQMVDNRDLGLLPEAEIHRRAGQAPPYEMARRPDAYPLERIHETALLAQKGPDAVVGLLDRLGDADAAVRFWAATGLGVHGSNNPDAVQALRRALADDNPTVRLAAAEGLFRLGVDIDVLPVLQAGLKDDNEWVRLHAINVLDRMGERARPALADIRAAAKDSNQYVVRVVDHARKGLER